MDQIETAIESRDPVQIATIMYESRRDLANTETGDGWNYHGRGYFQYTGRYNYTTYGEKFGVDLQNNPDLAAEPEMAAKLAIAYWKEKVPESARLDARAAGEAINGGPNGARDRVAASRQWATTITPELVRDIGTGTLTLEQLATRDVAVSPSLPKTLDTAAPATLAGPAAPGDDPLQPITQREVPSPLRPFNDIRHPQHALYSELKGCLPDYVSEVRLAQFTTAAHVAGIKPGQLESIHIDAERAAFTSRPGCTQAVVDMGANSPPLRESLERAQTFDLEQTQRAGQQVNRPPPEQEHAPVREH